MTREDRRKTCNEKQEQTSKKYKTYRQKCNVTSLSYHTEYS